MILPVDIQSRLAQTIQTHNAVSIATTAWSNGNWIDADGFDKVGVTMLNDASTSSQLNIQWSNDGSSIHGNENLLTTATSNLRQGITDIKARYFRVQLNNGDTISHTMSAWAYLKA
jgi:hypothetical protein